MSRELTAGRRAIHVAALLLVTALVTFGVWLAPEIATWVVAGRWANIGYWRAQLAPIRLLADVHPAGRFYPPLVRAALADRGRWWLAAALAIGGELGAVAAIYRVADARASRPVADRRWWQLEGLRPRAFARPHTVAQLLVRRPDPSRLVVGYYAGRLLTVEEDVQAIAFAAPRTGKTAGLVVPAIGEHHGPVVATSVRSDVMQITAQRRSQLGQVMVWDPFGPTTVSWDPLQRCDDWGRALLVARWLGSAVNLGSEHTNQGYFAEAAIGLTASLIHAAALNGSSIVDVYRWLLRRDEKTPITILKHATNEGADDARERLESVYKLSPQQKDGVIDTAQVQLQAYAQPAAARASKRRGEITPERLFEEGAANTLYLVADREYQTMLAPLIVTLLSSLLHHTAQLDNTGRQLPVPALFALDEAANIAPLEKLPQILSTSLPSARFLTIWHSVVQLRKAYGEAGAAEILALSQAKIFLGSITDTFTTHELSALIGQRTSQRGQTPELLIGQALQRTEAGEGLMIHTSHPPVFFDQRYYYRDRAFEDLKQAAEIANATGSRARRSR